MEKMDLLANDALTGNHSRMKSEKFDELLADEIRAKERIMAITTFDTHKFVRRLEEAGMSLKLAEVQAEVLTEAFNVNLESLVTKEHLEARLDARFAEQKSYMDTRFAGPAQYLLDAGILFELVRQLRGQAAWEIAAVGESSICTSVVVAAELRFGARKSGSKNYRNGWT